MGSKGPKYWPQASAGDYKGAQPPYLADKRPEGALSASFSKGKETKGSIRRCARNTGSMDLASPLPTAASLFSVHLSAAAAAQFIANKTGD